MEYFIVIEKRTIGRELISTRVVSKERTLEEAREKYPYLKKIHCTRTGIDIKDIYIQSAKGRLYNDRYALRRRSY